MHKQAAKNTFMLILAALATGVGVSVIVAFVPLMALLYIAGAGFVVYMVWVFYSMEKSRLETLDELKKQ